MNIHAEYAAWVPAVPLERAGALLIREPALVLLAPAIFEPRPFYTL